MIKEERTCDTCKFETCRLMEEPCFRCGETEEYKPDDEPIEKPLQPDNVNHPEHYTFGKYECIDEMIHLFGIEAVKDFCKCNAYKYRFRAGHKNGEEDIKKAEWYMGKLMELQQKEENAFFRPV